MLRSSGLSDFVFPEMPWAGSQPSSYPGSGGSCHAAPRPLYARFHTVTATDPATPVQHPSLANRSLVASAPPFCLDIRGFPTGSHTSGLGQVSSGCCGPTSAEGKNKGWDAPKEKET